LAAQLRRGSRLGKYRLEKRIGRGAFAEVWKARDKVENRIVALKLTHADTVAEWGRERIEHEARIASRLDHPGIVSVRNADWVDGRFVIASDLAKCNLYEYTRARRSANVALEVIREVASGLAYAHERKIFHRDVKPENILIFDDGRAALSDFGASRFARGAERTVTEAGTLGYMAPEQAYGRGRLTSDVFSLGLIAYEVLTGVLPSWPFSWPPPGFDRFETKVPEALRPVLRKAAQFDPRRRYPDAVDLYVALERAFNQAQKSRAEPKPTRPRTRKPAPSPLAVQADAFRRAHGKGLGMRFACYRCEGPIAETMPYCPWCGSAENSYRDLTSFPLVCPDCEKGVRPEWSVCPWCYPGRFESNGRIPPKDPEATRKCASRSCEGQLRPFMRYCPLCKRKPKRNWSHPDLKDRCPRCRWPTSHAFMRFCPWCGRREPRAGSYMPTR
jgi:serine/threonine-protein kinase